MFPVGRTFAAMRLPGVLPALAARLAARAGPMVSAAPARTMATAIKRFYKSVDVQQDPQVRHLTAVRLTGFPAHGAMAGQLCRAAGQPPAEDAERNAAGAPERDPRRAGRL